MSRTTSICQSALRLTAIAAVAGLVAGAESASAGNRSFNNMTKIPVVKVLTSPFPCTIGGPVEFRDLHVFNNSGRGFLKGRSTVYWQAKIAGRVVSGRTRLPVSLSPRETLVIPIGRGGQGQCQARIGA